MIYRGARILTVLAIAGHDQAWLQRTTRLGTHTIGRLLHDWPVMPVPATVEAVARSAGVSTEWLGAGDAGRPLSDTEVAELRRCLRVLRSIARGARIDARSAPNVGAETARRVPQGIRMRGARTVYRVVGDSLAHAGLLDGDLVYVRPANRVRDVVGSLVVARLNGMLYLKRLTVAAGGVVTLWSAADGYEPIVITAADTFSLLGEVVVSMRES